VLPTGPENFKNENGSILMPRPRPYYGWYIVLAGAVLNGFVGGLSIYCFTALVNPFIAAFGWSLAMVSLASSLRSLESGVLNPVVGFLADRVPARRLIISGTLIAGLGLFLLSRVSNIWMFYLSFLIITLGNSLAVHIVPITVVARWFKRDVGKAAGLMSVGIGLSGLLVPVVTMLIDRLGWQTTLAAMAGMVWLVGLPLAFVFRDRPRSDERQSGGAAEETSSVPVVVTTVEKTVRQALRTRAFWQIGASFMLLAAGISGVVVHIMPYLSSIGFSRTEAAMVAGSLPLVSIPFRFLLGWLADRYQIKRIIALALAGCGGGLLFFSVVSPASWGILIAFIIVFSIGLGGMTPLPPTIIRRYFGVRRFGAILGLMGIFTMAGSLLAPYLTGLVVDARGDYTMVWLVMGAILLAGLVAVLTAPPFPMTRPGSGGGG